MSELSKQALKVENTQSFPNNNAGLITPTNLRTFNEDMIDSTVNQAIYTTDSASFDSRIDAISGSASVNTGSLLTTASFNNNTRNLTFTKGDATQFSVNIPDATGSILPAGVVSGSSQINYPQISNIPSGIVSGSSQVSYTGLSNIPSGIISSSAQLPAGLVSGSSQVILQSTTGNLSGSRIDGSVLSATSASHAELADDATNSTFSVYADNTIVYGKNLHTSTIQKGTPLFFTGSGNNGNIVGVLPADASNPLRMPAGGVAGESLTVGSEGIILLDGFINGVDTSAFQSGQTVYVGVGGGYTNIRPTGATNLVQALGYVEKAAINGSGVIKGSGRANDVPNIQQGYAWVGNGSGVATAVPTASIAEAILGSNNTFTGTNSFQSISAISASFQYVQSVTGSAVIIGESFVVVNNDTPTAPYGGLSVYDSGSALPTTSSLVWDGNTNDWKYSYDVGVGHDAAVMLFGPDANGLANTPYPTNNKLQKGKGTHHLADSSIYDDGTTVAVNANLQVTGSITTNGNAVLVNADLAPLNLFTESQEVVNGALNAFTQSQQNLNATFATTGSNVFTGVNTFNSDTILNGTSSLYNTIRLNGGGLGDTTHVELDVIDSAFVLSAPSFVVGPQTLNSQYSSSAAGNQINLILKGQNATTDYIVSGSNNIGPWPSAPTAGFKRYVTSHNLMLGNTSTPQISGSMAWSPSINGNLIGHTQTNPVTWRGPVSSSASTMNHNVMMGGGVTIGTSATLHAEKAISGINVTSNGLFGGSIGIVANTTDLTNTITVNSNLSFGGVVTLNNISSSIAYNSNINNGTLTINNRFTPAVGSNNAVKSARTNVNTIYGTGHVINIDGTNVSTTQGKSASYNIFAGTFLTASVPDGDNSAMNATAMIGNGLVVTGSTLPATFAGPEVANSGQGSAFFGRFNSLDGTKSKSGETVFAVGTGTSYTNRKTGFLIDSGSNVFVEGTFNVSGSTIIETLTASLQEGYAWVGGVGNITNAVPTSSFGGGGGGAGFPYTGSAEITGSLGVTGSLSGYVNTLSIDVNNTASLNFNDGNFFILQLDGGTTTHLTATNIRPGQTINLLVKTDTGLASDSGSLTFSPTFKFAGGFDYTPTQITGSQDLVSFVTFDTTQILAAQVKNLS